MNKPCPFCGSNELSYRISTEDREGIPTSIFCQDCGCSGPWIYIKSSEIKGEAFEKVNGNWVERLPKSALELWNKRK